MPERPADPDQQQLPTCHALRRRAVAWVAEQLDNPAGDFIATELTRQPGSPRPAGEQAEADALLLTAAEQALDADDLEAVRALGELWRIMQQAPSWTPTGSFTGPRDETPVGLAAAAVVAGARRAAAAWAIEAPGGLREVAQALARLRQDLDQQ